MTEANFEPSSLSEEDPTKLCDPCMVSGVQRQADAYCQVCSEYLCDNCGELHRRFKATSKHELKSLDESSTLTAEQKALVSALMTCDDHSSETYTDFCVSHDRPICNLCKLIIHRKCEIKFLTEIARDENTQISIAESLDKTKALVTKFEQIRKLRGIDKAKVHSSSITIRKEIGKLKDEIVAWADQLEKSMLAKLEETEKTLIDEISNHKRISEEMVKQLTKIITSFETLGQDVTEASFALLKKVQAQISQGDKTNDEIMKEMTCQTIHFRKSTKLAVLLTDISEMGDIFTYQEQVTNTNFLEFPSPQALPNIEVDNQGGVTGCTFLPNDELVICDDSNKTVKVFTPDFILKNELQYETRVWDVAAVSEEEVIVTETDSKVLQMLDVSGDITKTKSIPVQQCCWGVDFKNDKIYTTCHPYNNTGGEVKVLTRDGIVIQTITVDQGNPFYLSVNRTGDKIGVCTYSPTVLCFDSTGHLLYTYSDSQLKGSLGLLFDSYDNFLVCGALSNNIHVVKSDGSKHQIMFNFDQKINNPYCLTYSPSSRTLLIGQYSSRSESLLALSIK